MGTTTSRIALVACCWMVVRSDGVAVMREFSVAWGRTYCRNDLVSWSPHANHPNGLVGRPGKRANGGLKRHKQLQNLTID